MALTWIERKDRLNGHTVWEASPYTIRLSRSHHFVLTRHPLDRVGTYLSVLEAKEAAERDSLPQSIAGPVEPYSPAKFLHPFQTALAFTNLTDTLAQALIGNAALDDEAYSRARHAMLTMVAKEGLAAVRVISELLVQYQGRDAQTADELACQMLVAAREDEYKGIKGLPRYPDPWRTAVDEALIAEGLDCLAPDVLPSAGLGKLIKHVKDEVLAECRHKGVDRVAELGHAFSNAAAKSRYQVWMNTLSDIQFNQTKPWEDLTSTEKLNWRDPSYKP